MITVFGFQQLDLRNIMMARFAAQICF